MRAEIIFTGTELLTGQVLNTHGKYLSERLSEIGVEVRLHTTVGDNWDLLKLVLKEAVKRSELIITTGGLGPTSDDLTKETVADLLNEKLVLNNDILNRIYDSFTNRGLKVPQCMSKQAMIPESAFILENLKGTAPGLLIEKEQTLILLPGPPGEMRHVFEHSVLPYLKEKTGCKAVSRSLLFKLTGIAEAFVQDKIVEMEKDLKNCDIAYLVNPGEVQLKIMLQGNDAGETEKSIKYIEEKVHEHFGSLIFGRDDEKLEELVGNLMIEKGVTIGLAESCTGGMIGSCLTSVPGSSQYFLGGIISYDNVIKEKVLGVPATVLERHGAVSQETACWMACGAKNVLESNVGLAVTGIAGPGGGTPEKPVGLVYVALYDGEKLICRRFILPGAREAVRKGTVNVSLNMLRHYLEGKTTI